MFFRAIEWDKSEVDESKNIDFHLPASEVLWTTPRLISLFPIFACLSVPEDGICWWCCWDSKCCCCWDCGGSLEVEQVEFVTLWVLRSPLTGYNGYYRPAIRTQSRLFSLLLYQTPTRINTGEKEREKEVKKRIEIYHDKVELIK